MLKFKIFKNLKKEGLLKDSIFMIFSNIYSKGMGYLFYFLTALILGTEGFGTLRGLLPLMDIITIFFCSGIPPSIAKHLSETENSNNEWIISILKIMVVFSILGAPIIILLKYILGGGYSTIDISIYIAVGFAIISSSFISWNRGVLQGSLKIKELSLTWIIENTSKIIFLIIFAVLFGVAGAFLSISIAYIIGGIFGYYLLLKYIKMDNINIKNINLFKWNNKHNKKVKQVLYYAVPIALGTASYRLLNDIDSIAIMSLLGAHDNGIYGYASLLSRAVFLFASAISIPLIPRIAKTKDINYLKKGLLLNFFIVLPVLAVVFIFAGELLKLFFGIVNNDATNCLKILSISASFMSSYTVCSSSLQGLGKAKIPLYILIIGIILNGILNYALIPKIGIIGGAYATLISSITIFLTILMYIYYSIFGSSYKIK